MSLAQIDHNQVAERQYLDMTIRAQQAEARRIMDAAIKVSGRRMWVSGSVSQLPITNVPACLEEAFGYSEQARLVAFYLGLGEEMYFYDGRTMTTGEIDAFLLFIRHRSIAPRLRGYHLGSSEAEAQYWLLMDREKRQLTVAPAKLAGRMVEAQWGPAPVEKIIVGDAAEWAVLVAELQARLANMTPDLLAMEIQHQLRVMEMLTWLNEC